MMQDVARIVRDPTEEDREWFPDIAGTGDEMAVLRDAWASHRDESFIGQYLSPRLMRQMRLFQLVDDPSDPDLRVEAIHDERGWRRLRRALALQHDPSRQEPDIVVQDVDLAGDRRLVVHHHVLNRQMLDEAETRQTLQHLADLWGYGVVLREVDGPGGATLREHAATPLRPFG
jgi:spore cortex formation protein SpoVR/YcgB (stage V sporulation)